MATSFKTKNLLIGALGLVIIALILLYVMKEPKTEQNNVQAGPEIEISESTQRCITCHGEIGVGKVISEQWKVSKHAAAGVGCLECHAAEEGDLDAFEHQGELIATIVTPKDCGNCHVQETEEFQNSHHADAGMIMGSLDNVLAEVVEGDTRFMDGANPAAANGCWQCHGSTVALLKDKDGNTMKDENGILLFDPKTWPNTGIGRINLDGSKGSCAACHNRHHFSVEQVRQPENCGKCHMGPDHPQLEIYNESKHGINYRAHREKMNLSAQPWVVGEDYIAAPTCATCHMSATPDQPVTHEVGNRISWTLRPPVSEKIDEAQTKKLKKEGKEIPEGFLSWEQRRKNMQNVCLQCHTSSFVTSFYSQYDSQVHLYNEKFGKPSTHLMNVARKAGLLTEMEFDEKIEWTYFYLWHHEGRRARMGASMMGPDYTQWHGNYEVADRFYNEFVPELEELIKESIAHGKAADAKTLKAALEEVMGSEMHKWKKGEMDPAEVQKRKDAAKAFRERYTGS